MRNKIIWPMALMSAALWIAGAGWWWGWMTFALLVAVIPIPAIDKPDLVIGDNYMHRWYVIPRNRWFNIYLHKIMSDDDDRALHDHPWHSLSFRLMGRLREWYFPKGGICARVRKAPRVAFRPATFAHRLEVQQGPVWTLFITGPRIREWGFHCFNGWVHWRDFVDSSDSGKIGRGCGG